MDMSLLIFIFVLALVVLVHEWGHFFAARRFGIRVDEFGFGFPPKLLAKRFGQTLYTLNLFPLGGFVKIFGETGEDAENPESFISRPVWQRAAVVVAGVVMNFILAWGLFSLGHVVGIPAVAGGDVPVHNPRVTITNVIPDSPAANAKLAFGSSIRSIRSGDDQLVPQTSAELIEFVNRHKGEELMLEIQPGSDPENVEVLAIQSRKNPPAGQGSLGIALADIGTYRSPWYRAPWEGLKTLWYSVRATGAALGSVFTSAVSEGSIPEGVSGPLGLFALTGQTQRLGVAYFIQFIALLSVNLGLLNIIPFPALDGGRLLFLIIEKVRGKALHLQYERVAHTAGFFLLILLILAISYRDINRFFL